MPDPTGRWLNTRQWQCPKCAWVNGSANEDCQKCGRSVRPPQSEPARPPDPLDLISHDVTRVRDATLVELATKAVHTLTRVTREKAMALIGDSLRNGLKKRGDQGDRAWQAITELPEDDQRAALGSLVDDLEEGGFALYRIDEDGHG
ncbi:MAG: hypothetical protein JO262_04755 [Solirubrobacterales bacterium]|nr:hypothetical protein [Solirubrobacterales bacterium]MBV9941421.1 hypothetical protein [Solirubrobacterales bacterium]